MFTDVQQLNRHFTDLWWDCSTGFPDLGLTYTVQAQTLNEKALLQFLSRVEHFLANPPRSREAAEDAKLRLGAAFRCLAEEALGFQGSQLELVPAQAFSDAAEEFVRKARQFDSRLGAEEIYQAGRNAWTAYGLQWLMGLPVELTPAIFAYSLLYPYTDNTLDDPAIPGPVKLAFNERLRRRLVSSSLAPANVQEKVIFDLVARIEGQYSRTDHPALFESLAAIHDAQSRSLDLQRAGPLADVDVVGLSFYKGGTSVLADGYLVNGTLTGPQRQYTYGHGVFAQLMDDLEDVGEDGRAGRLTVFTQPAGGVPLDALASRTIHFGQHILTGLESLEVGEPVRDLIRRGADLLLIDAIGRTDRNYTRSYLRELEAHFPFRFSFLKEQSNSFTRRYGPKWKLLETIMVYGKL